MKHKEILYFFLQLIGITGIAILISLMQGCGARKKQVIKESESVVSIENKDVVSNTKQIEADTLSLSQNFQSINIKAKDSTKPSSVEFQENKIITQNADVIITNEETQESYISRKEHSEQFQDKTAQKRKKDKANTIKDVKRDAMLNNYQIIGLFILGFAIIYLALNRKKIITWVVKTAKKIFLS